MSANSPQEKQSETTGKSAFERALERKTGETLQQLRDTPIDVRRAKVQRKKGFITRVISHWPFIGRGSVLRDYTVSRKEIEDDLDKLPK